MQIIEKNPASFTISLNTSIKSKKLVNYTKPVIITYAEDEILELIGPANTCGSATFGSPPFGHAYGYQHGRGHKH